MEINNEIIATRRALYLELQSHPESMDRMICPSCYHIIVEENDISGMTFYVCKNPFCANRVKYLYTSDGDDMIVPFLGGKELNIGHPTNKGFYATATEDAYVHTKSPMIPLTKTTIQLSENKKGRDWYVQ